MPESPNISQFIDRIRQSRAELDTFIQGLTLSTMIQPGVSGDWSVKDVLAHITWHEREMLTLITAHALVGSDLWDLPLDERNNAIFREFQNLDIKDVLVESSAVFKELMEALQTLSEEDLHDPSRFPNMPSDWKPWELIAQNTYEHYEDHLADLRAWNE